MQTQLSDFKSRLINNTYTVFELQIEYLSHKITKILDHLNTFEPNRNKRGLIDGLGSIIKSVTGNLDSSDAVKYDTAINALSNNQIKIANEYNNHVSINKEWMTQHSKIVTQIVQNQLRINETLNALLRKNIHDEISLVHFAKFAQLLTIITENADDVLMELLRIENILAFIRASSTHHSMLGIDVIRKMVDRLKIIYSKDCILDLEYREYYDIIKPGYYFSDKRIVITLKFPIISTQNYELYKLSVLPNRYNQSIIPPYPLIVTNKQAFMYIEAECPKRGSQYLCEENMTNPIKTQEDCIQHLLINQSLDPSCKRTTVQLSTEAFERLDARHYTLSLPYPTKIHTVCGREDFNTIQGSFLVTVPVNCFLHTPEFTIGNYNDQIEGIPLKIMKIPFSETEGTKTIGDPYLKLTSINLQGLHKIEERVVMQPTLQLSSSTPDTLYHTTIPIYAILLGALVVSLTLYVRRHRNHIRQQRNAETNTEDPKYTDSKETREQQPATFSLKVLK